MECIKKCSDNKTNLLPYLTNILTGGCRITGLTVYKNSASLTCVEL